MKNDYRVPWLLLHLPFALAFYLIRFRPPQVEAKIIIHKQRPFVDLPHCCPDDDPQVPTDIALYVVFIRDSSC